MKLGVTIHTYRRLDGTTPMLLKRALESVANQSFQDFKIFVIGDKYDNNLEFQEIINWFLTKYPSFEKRVFSENLNYAKERDKYLGINNTALWNCGGTNALNYATQVAIDNGFTKICHLDHDDYWEHNHLDTIVNAIKEKENPAFIHTLSTYLNHEVFPQTIVDNQIIEHYPHYCNLIHSSTYIDYNKIPFRYRDLWEEEQRYFPSDGDMWERIRVHCESKNLKCYLVRKLTCYHENENY